ncbi:MAG: response regulator [Chloroherpetonaceae bacterium]|nr:response regulator [Chthonomonadaceae bacterium]MDW8209143.1 response regulator [Chloroherpetonaceae bacterium]
MPQEKPPTLLVVDDEPLMTELLQHMMSREGYQVLTAHNGVEALQIVRREGSQVDLILLDISMPDMDGLQTARALQQEMPGIPVLIATGFGDVLAEHAFPANVAGVVSKPYQGKVIAARISEILRSTSGGS